MHVLTRPWVGRLLFPFRFFGRGVDGVSSLTSLCFFLLAQSYVWKGGCLSKMRPASLSVLVIAREQLSLRAEI